MVQINKKYTCTPNTQKIITMEWVRKYWNN